MNQTFENLTDREVVEKVLCEDKQLFGILVNRYQNMIFRVALENLNDHESAGDALQETFFKAYRNLHRLNKPESFASWIYSITMNVCRNMKRKNRKNTISIDDIDERSLQQKTDKNIPLIDKEKYAVLKGIIKKLPKKHRQIIDLRYTEGFCCSKIANFLGISERSVVNRLYYARKLILKMIKKEGLV